MSEEEKSPPSDAFKAFGASVQAAGDEFYKAVESLVERFENDVSFADFHYAQYLLHHMKETAVFLGRGYFSDEVKAVASAEREIERLKTPIREGDKIYFDSIEQDIEAVSYTHLTLPTNREV